MKTVLRFGLGLSILSLAGSVAALFAGVGQSVDPPPLRFDPDPFVIPSTMNQLDERDFKVAVVNDADEPARIVGVEEFCSSACYYGRGLPVTVPARGRGWVTIHVAVNSPGPITDKVYFFTDRPSQPKLAMRIEGYIWEDELDEAPTQASNR